MFAHIRVLIVALMTAGAVLAQAQAQAQAQDQAQVPATAPAKPVKMVVLGDSLSAGLGLQARQGFAEQGLRVTDAAAIEVVPMLADCGDPTACRLALQTDTTRVITFQWSREAGGFGAERGSPPLAARRTSRRS